MAMKLRGAPFGGDRPRGKGPPYMAFVCVEVEAAIAKDLEALRDARFFQSLTPSGP